MTAAKSLQRKEVEKVTAALRSALQQECPGENGVLFDYAPALRKPTSKRGAALWEAYRLAWSAAARFTRREERSQARKRGQGAAFFDDRRTEAVVTYLEVAKRHVRKAGEALERDIARIRNERARIGLPGDDVGAYPEHVRALSEIVHALELRVKELKKFEGIPQARTPSEWDAFVSETARNLLVVGFGTREVAALLTGKKPEAIDRATLERFRQRVSRLEISSG